MKETNIDTRVHAPGGHELRHAPEPLTGGHRGVCAVLRDPPALALLAPPDEG